MTLRDDPVLYHLFFFLPSATSFQGVKARQGKARQAGHGRVESSLSSFLVWPCVLVGGGSGG